MKTTSGWKVYLKIKELSNNNKSGDKPEIRVDELKREMDISKEQLHEYLTALAVLKFIEFTDKTKQAFVLTDLGQDQ